MMDWPFKDLTGSEETLAWKFTPHGPSVMLAYRDPNYRENCGEGENG